MGSKLPMRHGREGVKRSKQVCRLENIMAQYALTSLSGYFGLPLKELHNRLSALNPLLQSDSDPKKSNGDYVDDYGFRLLLCLDRLLHEETEALEVGRAAHQL